MSTDGDDTSQGADAAAPRRTVPAALSRARQAAAQDAHRRAMEAIKHLVRAGTPLTFAAVADRAGVSRRYLYTQAGLADQIRTRRDRQPVTAVRDHGGDQPVLDALRHHVRKLEHDHAGELRILRAENTALRQQLQTILGELIVLRSAQGHAGSGS